MQNKDLVSIFVPVYNAEKFIKECILSIINQNYQNIEIVISDDASTDNTPIILKELEKKFSNKIKLFLQENNIGITNNFNFILSKCTGKYILFTAGDDMLKSNCISDTLDIFENNNDISIVFHNSIRTNENGEILKKEKEKQYKIFKGNIRTIIKDNFIIKTNGMMILKEKIPFDGYNNNFRYASDFDFILRVLKDSNFIYINKQLSYYRKNNNSITSSKIYECSKDNLILTANLILEYPEYSNYLKKQISNILRGTRLVKKSKYYDYLIASLNFNRFNFKSLIGLIIYLITFGKVKL
ncbi:glycosyltransferase [Malaciobacter mytili]|uniref:glycosyltransferase n=1 Tax=Malaciobacter mytili TaxID=603050 RepID=UPI003A8B3122